MSDGAELLWPQFFVTLVIGSEALPDVEILPLPAYEQANQITDLRDLENLIISRQVEGFETIGGGSIMSLPGDCLTALHQAIIDACVREELPWQPERWNIYAQEIFDKRSVAVMNSPISGKTLSEMVAAAGGGAAFMAALPHDVGHITLYFLMIGGTKIVLGASGGISMALEQGLCHILLKWMGVPGNSASCKKSKRKQSSSGN